MSNDLVADVVFLIEYFSKENLQKSSSLGDELEIVLMT